MTTREKGGFASEPIIQKLLLLVLVYIFSIAAILVVENYFNREYVLEIQQKIQNQEQKQKIDGFLRENILQLRLLFNRYPFVKNGEELSVVQNGIKELIARSNTYLDVLKNGGIVSVVRSVSLPNQDEITEIIEYQPDSAEEKIPEIEMLQDKLSELQSVSNKIAAHINSIVSQPGYDLNSESDIFKVFHSNCRNLFEKVMQTENVILFTINKRVVYLSNTNLNVVKEYNQLKYSFFGFFALIIIVITWIITRQVHTLIKNRNIAEYNNRKLLLAVEQSPVSIMIADTQGNLEYVNNGFENTSGYSKEEAIVSNRPFFFSSTIDNKFLDVIWQR